MNGVRSEEKSFQKDSSYSPIAFFTSVYRPVAWSESSRTSSTTRAPASSAQRPAFALRATACRAGYAIEPAAPISRRPQAPDAVAGPGVRRVARMVQEPSLQAAGPRRAARHAGQAGVGWRSIGRSPTAINLKNTGGGHRRGRPILVGRAMTVTDHAAALFFRAVARDRHPTPACTASRTLRAYEKCFRDWGLGVFSDWCECYHIW